MVISLVIIVGVAGIAVWFVRQQAERKIARIAAESERQRRLYETVLSNTPDLAYVFDLNHRFTYANPALLAMWGRTWDDAVGKNCLELGYEPWHAEMHDREIEHVVATKQSIRGEVAFDGTNGRRQYDYIFVPVIGATGEVEAVAGTTRDVTDRHDVEKAVRAGDERLRAALAAARTVAWEWTPADGKLRVSENAAEVFGLPAGVGLTGIEQGLALIHPDDADMYRATYQQAIENRSGYNIRYRLIRPDDGRTIWIGERGQAVFDQPDGGVRLYGVAGDVSERQLAEDELARLAAAAERERRLFAAVLLNTPDFIYTFDLQGRFVYVNAALLSLWGKSLEEAVGKNFFELDYPPELAERLQQQIQQVIDTKQPVRDETPYTSAVSERMYEYIFTPVVGAGDVVEAVAGSTRDITDRKMAEVERERLLGQLRDQDRRKDEFLATLAHELRNPLAPISNGLHIMRLAGASGTIEETRAMMDRQLTQLIRLVDDLLDMSRVTSGKLALRRESVELCAVIKAAIETSKPAIDHAGHKFTIVVPDEPIVLDGDPARLAQVVSNLLNNSAKYTHRGGHVRLTVTREECTAVLVVADDGIGIPHNMLGTVFEMFTQVDRALEKTTGGLGIGLSLVKGLVEMHGGTIEARSEGEGRGSEFIVRLPVMRSSAQAVAPPAVDRSLEVSGRRRILVTDDNVDAAASLAMFLELLGNDVRTANDGLEAVALAEAFIPDVVLLDIAMPNLNGFEACRRIREQPWGQKAILIALTGWGQDEDQRRSLRAGFDLHLVKPVDPVALERLLASSKAPTH